MSGAVLSPATADRLVRLLGMLGSDHDGEAANAGRMADRLIRSLGLRWNDLIGPQLKTGRQQLASWREPRNWRDAVRLSIQYPDVITDWELSFVESLQNYRSLTPRQNEVLWQIVDKIRDVLASREAAA